MVSLRKKHDAAVKKNTQGGLDSSVHLTIPIWHKHGSHAYTCMLTAHHTAANLRLTCMLSMHCMQKSAAHSSQTLAPFHIHLPAHSSIYSSFSLWLSRA